MENVNVEKSWFGFFEEVENIIVENFEKEMEVDMIFLNERK